MSRVCKLCRKRFPEPEQSPFLTCPACRKAYTPEQRAVQGCTRFDIPTPKGGKIREKR